MSMARVQYVKHARQRYAQESTGERTPVMTKVGTPRLAKGGRPVTRRQSETDHDKPLPLYKCSRCGDVIEIGAPYRYWRPGFRSRAKIVRCMKPTCSPRPSELESSAMSTVLAAVEDAQGQSFGDVEDASAFFDALQPVIDALDEVAEQYREAAEHFGGVVGDMADKADELDSMRDALEAVTFDDPPERDTLEDCGADDRAHGEAFGNLEGCPDCDAIYDTAMSDWRDEQESALSDALAEVG